MSDNRDYNKQYAATARRIAREREASRKDAEDRSARARANQKRTADRKKGK